MPEHVPHLATFTLKNPALLEISRYTQILNSSFAPLSSIQHYERDLP